MSQFNHSERYKTTSHSEVRDPETFDMMQYYKSLILEDLQKGLTFYGSEEELTDLQHRLLSYLNEEDGILFEKTDPNYLFVKYEINARVFNK